MSASAEQRGGPRAGAQTIAKLERAGVRFPVIPESWYKYSGYVVMMQDRSLVVMSREKPDSSPTRKVVRPGEDDYEAILSRVGGLKPYETKAIPRDAPK